VLYSQSITTDIYIYIFPVSTVCLEEINFLQIRLFAIPEEESYDRKNVMYIYNIHLVIVLCLADCIITSSRVAWLDLKKKF